MCPDPINTKSCMEIEESSTCEVAKPPENTPTTPINFRQTWKDPEGREKILYSVFLAFTCIGQGLCAGQHGPTLLDIQILTNTDLESSSIYFTVASLGGIVGSLLTGLIYNRSNKPLLLFILIVCCGVGNIIIPYCTVHESMIFIRFLTGILNYGVGLGVNAEHVRIWRAEANGLLQCLHFCFSIGCLLGPLIAEPFLAEKNTFHINSTASISEGAFPNSTSYPSPSDPTQTDVHYVFVITGVVILLSAFPFLFVLLSRSRVTAEAEGKSSSRSERGKLPFPIFLLMIAGVGLFFFTFRIVDPAFFAFLMAFLVEGFPSISKSKGAIVLAVAWAGYTFARFSLMFLAKYLTPFRLLLIMLISLVVSLSCLTVLAYNGITDFLVVFSTLVGVSLAGIFPTAVTWVESEMFKVTGLIMSYIQIMASLGAALSPVILGYLMKERHNMWFCYFLLITSIVASCILAVFGLWTRCFVEKRYRGRTTIEELEHECCPAGDADNGDKEEVAGEIDQEEEEEKYKLNEHLHPAHKQC